MKKNVLLVFYSFLFFACQPVDTEKNLTGDDTVKIINSILNGKEFLKENLNVDTLYFLRNKLFNENLFKAKDHFEIKSLEDNSRSRMANIGPSYPYDGRERLSVFKFDYKNDSVKVGMYEHGGNLFYETELGLKKGNWLILKQRVYSGGRIKKFEFENEAWYKELKKKVKPHQPMFPPPPPN